MILSISLPDLLSRSEHVMFDFDGPVCSVFAGHPAPAVADRLRDLVRASTELPAELADVPDPMLFLYAAPKLPGALGERVREQFQAEELQAVESAEPTPGAHAAIVACSAAGKMVSVVSNNSASAVEMYLQRHDLMDYINFVSARRSPDPALMKPHPYLVLAAIEATGQDAVRSVLIGDSVTDIQAAHAARSAAIGYANKIGKSSQLKAAGAEATTQDMRDISDALRCG